MTDAKLAPNLPDWMVEHANRYLSSGGPDGHLYKMTQPGRPEITVPALLLTTTGRNREKGSSSRSSTGKPATAISSSRPKAAHRNTPAGTATFSPTRTSKCRLGPRRRGAGEDSHGRGARPAVGKGVGVLAALR